MRTGFLWLLLAAAPLTAEAGPAADLRGSAAPEARGATGAVGAAGPVGATGAAGAAAAADDGDAENGEPGRGRRWRLRIDDDFLAFAHRDRDYTAGIVFALTGEAALRAWNPSGILASIDEKVGFASLSGPRATRIPALETGLQLFTPQDLRASVPLPDDRPYASLLYLATSALAHDASGRVAYQSTLTFGVLGLRFAELLQRAVHTLTKDPEPAGYGHQISAGGEPTLRYTVARYGLLAAGTHGRRDYALRFDTQASIGYLTEADASVAILWGNSAFPWWESALDSGDYAGQPAVTGSSTFARRERRAFELFAGVRLRVRLYDGFLEGQFRSSDVAYSSSEVEHLLYEGWVGADVVLKNDLVISYAVRRQSKELKRGRGAHAFTWGALSIARRF